MAALFVAPEPRASLELPRSAGASSAAEAVPLGSFGDVYEEHFDFVFRNARRLGIAEAHVDDAVQEVFLVLHRRFGELADVTSMKAWLFGTLARVAADHRRLVRRKSPHARGEVVDADAIADTSADPHERAARNEAARTLHRVLDELTDDRRAVFVLAELEQMTAPEIAESLGQNLNTVYARLRSARQDFEAAVARERARDNWRAR